MFNLLEKENVGEITLGNKVRVSDPCYAADTWCAGTLENVLEGKYDCYSQSVDEGEWGVRIASIEVRHKDYSDVEPVEAQDIDVGVDSGQCGIYDLDYFVKNREDKGGEDKWYWRVCDNTYKFMENPIYVPFEKSKWWEDEFKTINKVNKIDNIPSDLILRYYKAKDEYLLSNCSRRAIGKYVTDTLDGKCLVSSSGDGDGNYTCLVGRNKDGKIVSIKIDYYYGEEDEEDWEDEEGED